MICILFCRFFSLHIYQKTMQFLKTCTVNYGIYDTSLNNTLSTEPFHRKGFLSKCHFVESPLRQNRFSSNTFDEIFYAHLAAILYLLIL